MIIIVIILFINNIHRIYASSKIPLNIMQKEVIILVDTSGSMKKYDNTVRYIYDFFINISPSNYKLSIITYSTNINNIYQNIDKKDLINNAQNINFKGYSNARIGLQKAVSIFDNKSYMKNILLVSDGEIELKSEDDTKIAIDNFNKNVIYAKENGIKIFNIALDKNNEYMENASKETGGSNYNIGSNLQLEKALSDILFNKFDIKRNEVFAGNTSSGNINIKLPSLNVDISKILLKSTGDISNITTNINAEGIDIITRDNFSIITVKNPNDKNINISFTTKENSEVKAWLVNEFNNYKIIDDITYIVNEKEDKISTNIKLHIEKNGNNIFDDFNGEEILVSINDEKFNEKIEDGYINIITDKNFTSKYNIWLNFKKANFINTNNIKVTSERPILVKPNYTIVYIGLISILLLIGILIILYKKRLEKKTKILKEEEMPTSKYGYNGKLNIFITKTKNNIDILPIAYNLLRVSSNRVISLEEILLNCEVNIKFEGAEKIHFKAWANRSLMIINKSDCTIIKNREILMKNKSYEIMIDNKIDIVFEDEISEITMQYKDLKPNEIYI